MNKFFLFIKIFLFASIINAQEGSLDWAFGLGATQDDIGFASTVDNLGNVYVTGSFQGIVDFDPGIDVFNLSNIDIGGNIFITKYDSLGNLEWAKQIGGNFVDEGKSITIDTFGNVIITGVFWETVDFDPSSNVYNLTSAGGWDVCVVKLDTSGNFLWAKQMGGNQNDYGQHITVDADGNIYSIGYFDGIGDFDPGNGVAILSSGGALDTFISKLDSAGNFLWAKQFSGFDNNLGSSIAVDSSGNIYTTGWFWETVDFDPGNSTFNLISDGNNDIFISKLDSSGNFVWAKKLGGSGFSYATAITVDALENVYSTGFFSESVDFDPNVNNVSLISNGGHDAFISKLDTSGNFLWAKQLGGTTNDSSRAIALDQSSNLYISGSFTGTADFDPGAEDYNLTALGGYDAFVNKLDSGGNFLWAAQFGGIENSTGYDISVDPLDNVYTTGAFSGIVDFDPSNDVFNIVSNGELDIFIHKTSQLDLSIVENNFGIDFKVYPNPFRENIQIDLGDKYNDINIFIRNLTGKVVAQKRYSNLKTLSMDLDLISNGVYIIEIQIDTKKSSYLRIIKY